MPVLSVGGIGVVSVLSNIIPRDVHDMVYNFLNGNIKTAIELQLNTLDLTSCLFSEVNPIPIKKHINILGMMIGFQRLTIIKMR